MQQKKKTPNGKRTCGDGRNIRQNPVEQRHKHTYADPHIFYNFFAGILAVVVNVAQLGCVMNEISFAYLINTN